MKLKFSKIVDSFIQSIMPGDSVPTNSLDRLSPQPLDPQEALLLFRTKRELRKELEAYQEGQKKLLSEYCIEQGNGNYKYKSPEDKIQYESKNSLLLSTEIEVDVTRISFESFLQFGKISEYDIELLEGWLIQTEPKE